MHSNVRPNRPSLKVHRTATDSNHAPGALSLLIVGLMVLAGTLPLQANTTAASETRNLWMNWIVSNGIFEAGGRVIATGLPSNVRFDRIYPVNFTFYVDAFDWGSSIRPGSVEWFARVGCVQGDGVACVRNRQNMTLGISSIEGNFSRDETFGIATHWILTGQLVSSSVQSVLGMRMPATVECWDTKFCLPKGKTSAMVQSSLNPEISMPLTTTSNQILSSSPWWYSVSLWGFLAGTAVAVFAGAWAWKRYKNLTSLSNRTLADGG